MAKKVKRMVELESKIREREIEVKKKEVEIAREKKRKEEENKREKLERERIERMRLEEEEKKKAEEILRVAQEQLAIQQAQMKALMEKEEIRLSQVFDGTLSRVSEFMKECRKYMERKMKKVKMEDKIYWVISYVQGESTKEWKEKKVDEIFEDRWKNRNVEEILKERECVFGKGKKVEEHIWKGLDSFGDVEKGMDRFWEMVKEKEVEKKEMPIVVAMTPKRQTARRGSFWTR